MKLYALAGATMLCVSPAWAGDAVVGLWKTGIDHGGYAYVQMSPCGSSICGTITRTFDTEDKETKSDSVGKRVIWDMVAQGEGKYDGGKILQPGSGKVYKSKMELSGSKLIVKGCAGFICGGQTWNRVN